MKVLLINGSPKAKGCTYTALCEVAKELTMKISKPRFSILETIRSAVVWLAVGVLN